MSITAAIATTLMALAAITVITACSPKSSTEETAAQTKALVDQAVGEAKKEIITEQAAEKARQDAIAATQAEDKIKKDAAVAAAKKERVAEQHAAAAKAKSREYSSNPTPTPTPTNKIVCTNCAVVLSVNEVETEGQGSGVGVVAGGVVGGLLGNQVGQGTGKDLATIAGVVGGAYAGNKIEKISKKTKSYDITVRMDDGSERTFRQATDPGLFRGQKVKIENDVVVKD